MIRVMNTQADLVETKVVDLVIWELYKAGSGGIIRLIDEDSGEVITMIKHPTFNKAKHEYDN